MKPRCWCNGRAFRVDLVFILTVGLWGAALDAWSSGEVPTSAGLTVELSTTAPTFSTGVRFGVQAQFSEPVDEFTTGAIVLGGGTGEIVDLTGTGQLFRFRVIPAGESPIVISVPAGSVSDADGKANLGSNLLRVAPNASMDPSLKVYLTFDETRGTRAFDSSACGNHAALRCRDLGSQGFSFATHSVAGARGNALRFDGLPLIAHAVVPSLNTESNHVTIAAWIKRQGSQAWYAGIVMMPQEKRASGPGVDGPVGLNVRESSNELGYAWGTDQLPLTYASGLVVPDNKWVHVAVAVEPDKTTLYLTENGVTRTAVRACPHAPMPFNRPLLVGGGAGRSLFRGAIDEVRVYDRVLSAGEVGDLASPSPMGCEVGRVAAGDAGTTRTSSTDYASGQRATLTYPNGRRLAYAYWPGAALKSMTNEGSATPLVFWDYIGSRLLRRAAANGVHLDLRNGSATYYDGGGRATRWSYPGAGGGEYGWTYTYDRGGNPVTAECVRDAKDSQAYTYDSASRLRSYTRGNSQGQTWSGMVKRRDWHPDGVGNWSVTASTDANDQVSTLTWYDTSFNEYYQVAIVSISSDDNGNTTYDGSLNYRWDAVNRLAAALDGSAVTTVSLYAYDAGGRRVRKDIYGTSAGDVDYAQAGSQTLEERDAADTTVSRQFVYGAYVDEPLVMNVNADADTWTTGAADAVYYYLQNRMFSVGALTNSSGTIIEAYEYDPYGRHTRITDGNSDGHVDFDATDARTTLTGSTLANPYTFTARNFDPETKLLYFRSRYCQPEGGRFLSRDSMGYAPGPSLYEYARTNPLGRVDPSGMWGPDVHYGLTYRNLTGPGSVGLNKKGAQWIADADNGTDSLFGGEGPLPWVGNQGRHLGPKQNGWGPARWVQYEKEEASNAFRNAMGDKSFADSAALEHACKTAMLHVGRALHSAQDMISHRLYPGWGNHPEDPNEKASLYWPDWRAHPTWWDIYDGGGVNPSWWHFLSWGDHWWGWQAMVRDVSGEDYDQWWFPLTPEQYMQAVRGLTYANAQEVSARVSRWHNSQVASQNAKVRQVESATRAAAEEIWNGVVTSPCASSMLGP